MSNFNVYDRVIDILIESRINSIQEGLQRDLRVQRAINKRLHGNIDQSQPNSPHHQSPGINSDMGREFLSTKERSAVNSKATDQLGGIARRAAKRHARIGARMARGGAAAVRMNQGIAKGQKKPSFVADDNGANMNRKQGPAEILSQAAAHKETSRKGFETAANRTRNIRLKRREELMAAKTPTAPAPRPSWRDQARNPRTPGES